MIKISRLYQKDTGYKAFGDIEICAYYGDKITPKQALINFIQRMSGNLNTWTYPSDMEGITESKVKSNVYYYGIDNPSADYVYQAIEE